MRQIVSILGLLVLLSISAQASHPHPAPVPGAAGQHARYDDLQWQIMVPELGADGPQAAILRVDSKTQATQLLIRMPKCTGTARTRPTR